MINAMKFEMMYQARMLSSKIIMKAMKLEPGQPFDRMKYLEKLDLCRFDVGYYDTSQKQIYSEIEGFGSFSEQFQIHGGSCYSVIEDPSEHLGVRYIVLQESQLAITLQKLRMRIISYLVLSFILMGVVGYFLGRLFLQPVREQIESLDRFISDTTHELNTPISAILMTTQSLKGIEEKKLARLQASAKRLTMMYSSLTYRLEGKEEQDTRINIGSVVEERVEYMKELIESKRLRVKMDVASLPVMMTRDSIHRLIDNLLSNAIKYSNVGDSIIITLHRRVLTIEDSGIGMSEEEQRDIFKRYQRANQERGGFGIGLSIVMAICNKYTIDIELVSEKGKGSKFILTFPKKG